MTEIRRTAEFDVWFRRLRDRRAQMRISIRLDRIKAGNIGDARSVGSGVLELRIDYGPGYRLYFVRRGPELILLLCGGDKSSQDRDIIHAKIAAEKLRDNP